MGSDMINSNSKLVVGSVGLPSLREASTIFNQCNLVSLTLQGDHLLNPL
jgi:hypothetical protein